MKKEDLFGILLSSLLLGACLNFPLFGMFDEYNAGHRIGALILGLTFTFMIGTWLNILLYKNDELKEEIEKLKKEIETLKNNEKE